MPTSLKMIGDRYGSLVVLSFHDRTQNRKKRWLCQCACGNTVIVIGADMRAGKQVSCGCVKYALSVERMRIQSTIHGLAHTPINATWKAMTQRCYNSNSKGYEYYGGRGIRICEFIRASPANLKALIGDRPKSQTVDRKNNDGHYSCGSCAECVLNGWALNVRWATLIQQGRNQSTNHILEYKGESHCLSEWSEITGLPRTTIMNRVRDGWTVERILTHPRRNQQLHHSP